MSLINQALRKAQRDRTPNRMPLQPGEPTPTAYGGSSHNGMRPGWIIGLIIVVALLIGLVAGLSVVIIKDDNKSVPAATATAPVTAPTTTEPLNRTAPTPTSPVDPQITLPSTSSIAEPIPAPEHGVVEELRKARAATEAEAAAQAEAAAAEAKKAEQAAARAAAHPSEDIIDWLSQAKVSAVRLSDTESKVILNGKTYSEGEYVNFKLGLKVMVIQESRLLFMDNNGKKYMKRL